MLDKYSYSAQPVLQINFSMNIKPDDRVGKRVDNLRSCHAQKGLALCLALTLLLLRISRVSAEDDTVGYRHEFYREDNNRIKVDTDSGHFDIGLGSKVRFNGDVVYDAISGATPTGAPAQTKWPFPTFNDLYHTAYKQAYTGQFNQFVGENQIYVDAGYETYHEMTNSAAQYALTTAPGIATNSATSSFHSLTNNPNFRKNTVPLTQMHDHRVAFSLGLPVTLKSHLITPSFAYSEESDYISHGVALNDSIFLKNKNTTLNLGWSHNFDRVVDDKFIWQNKNSDDILIGCVQLLGPKSYLTANVTLGFESGYLSDPYRGVMAANFLQTNPDDAALLPEKRPRNRTKEILYLSWTQFVDPLNGSLELGYRYFHDNWDINAHTMDFNWHQKIGKRIVVSPHFRYYYQTAVNFYDVMVPDFNNLPKAYSADYRLSEFQSLAFGVKVTCRIHRYVSLDAGYMRYVMEGLDGITSPSAYPSANVFTIGARVWF